MEIRVLRYFIEIVNTGNISNAANALHVSQPALSRQIMELENELGVTLFERGHRQIKLTEEGHYLYERAQEITSLVDKTTDNLQSQEVVSGTLDISAGESPALQVIMDVIGQLTTQYPGIRVNLLSGDTELIRQWLDNGSLDFGIIMGHTNLNNYHSLTLPKENRWGVLMRSDEKLADKELITPTDLVGRPLITSFQSKQQDVFRNWAGVCMALTYDGLIDPQNTEFSFHPLTPAVVDDNTLIWNKNHPQTNVNRLFLKKLQQRLG